MSDVQKLKVWKIRLGAQLLTRGSDDAVGYDMRLLLTESEKRLSGSVSLRPFAVHKLSTGIGVAIPRGHYGRVAPRSGLGFKGIHPLGGVIDPDYRGEVMVMLVNLSLDTVVIEDGERIAQLILERCSTLEIEECDLADIDETTRGTSGFGSTGRK